MNARFELSARAALALVGADESVVRKVAREMDPYVAAEARGTNADVVLEAVRERGWPRVTELVNPAGDALVTASDGSNHYLLDGARACSLPDLGGERPFRLVYDAGFPIARMFRSVVRPALQIAALDHDAVAVHSATVEVGGKAVVVAGWSESGKTETALAFLEEGARFISDKWTLVGADGAVANFPISVGVRRWALRHLPRLRAALPRRARVQLAAAGVGAAASRPLGAVRAAGKVGEVAVAAMERAVELADRAALTPSEIRAAYGGADDPNWTSSLDTVALLTTVPGHEVVTARPADPEWAARRLARSAAFERRRFFELHARSRYTFPERDGLPDLEAREERFLAEVLAPARVLVVRAPFPVDPRRVADAIGRLL